MKLQTRLTKSLRTLLNHYPLSSISLDDLKLPLRGVYHPYQDLVESVATPQATNMNFLPEARVIQSPTYATPDIFTLNLHGVYFCPEYHILHTESHQIIEESISTQRDLNQFNGKFLNNQNVEVISGFCSTFRSHKNGYYHTLIDNLPRLYLLNHSRFNRIDEIKIILLGKVTSVEKFYLNKLLPENSQVTLVTKGKQYKLENLIFPGFLSRRFAGYLPSQYRTWFIDKVAPKRPRKKINRIFISRIATHKGRQRCILNEDELFAALKAQGFKKYVLEHLTIEEQIELFYDADTVVAAHGAGLANTLFSEQIKVLELFPTAFVLPHYYYLAQSLGHNYGYWCAQEKGIYDNFKVNVTEVIKSLERLNSD